MPGLFRIDGWTQSDSTRPAPQPRVYAYYFKQWTKFVMPSLHAHNWTEIMYVLSGTCQVEVEAKSIGMKRGDFILVGHSVPHRLIVEQSCRMLNLEFGFARPDSGDGPASILAKVARDERALDALLTSAASYVVLKDPDEVFHALKSLVFELDTNGKQGSPFATMLLIQLLVRIARLREESASGGAFIEERYVRGALDFIRQNYDRDIRVRDVAAAVNLHPGYLQRIFKEATGRTLIEELTAIRIDKAKMLLKMTDIPVTDIYDYAGVGSRQYFHALFKRHTGLTPIQYRESPENELWNFD